MPSITELVVKENMFNPAKANDQNDVIQFGLNAQTNKDLFGVDYDG